MIFIWAAHGRLIQEKKMSIETSLMIISITQLFLAIAIVFVSLTQRDIRMFIRRLSAGVQDLINTRGAQE